MLPRPVSYEVALTGMEEVPTNDSDQVENVLTKATAVAERDAVHARCWFLSAALADFGGATARIWWRRTVRATSLPI